MTRTMADPNRIRLSDPVCSGCGKQAKTVALWAWRFLCPACVLVVKGLLRARAGNILSDEAGAPAPV